MEQPQGSPNPRLNESHDRPSQEPSVKASRLAGDGRCAAPDLTSEVHRSGVRVCASETVLGVSASSFHPNDCIQEDRESACPMTATEIIVQKALVHRCKGDSEHGTTISLPRKAAMPSATGNRPEEEDNLTRSNLIYVTWEPDSNNLSGPLLRTEPSLCEKQIKP